MGGIFSTAPQPLPEIPDRDTAEVRKASDEQRLAAAAAQGRASTFLGGNVGTEIAKKSILGA